MEQHKKVIPYGRQNITADDIAAVVETLKADFLTQGPKIEEFEKAFATYVGAKYAIAVSNATAGLHLAVKALQLNPGERVITTPITFAASANCVRYCGGEVWFADIDPDTYLVDINAVSALIESKPKGFFKGIIPVDFAGLPVNLEAFRTLANEHDLWLIEDACHAPGGYFTDSTGKKQKCGNGKFAEISVFSFHPVKHIACGEGGMLTTNSEELYKQLRQLRTHGIVKDYDTIGDELWRYDMCDLGYNYRLTDIQSALGISQLKKNDNGVKRRNEIARLYSDSFKGKVKYQKVDATNYNAYHLFVIEVPNRLELYQFLRNRGIFAQIHYIPVHTLEYYKKIDYTSANLKNAESYYAKCISLPMFPTLTNQEIQFVIQSVLDCIHE